MNRGVVGALVMGLVAVPLLARPVYADAPAATDGAVSPKRPIPLYDGRPPEPTPVGEYFLGVPRFILAPPYLVEEYVLRRPLSVAIPAAEQIDLFTRVYDFFVFGRDHKAGILPVGFAEFDFNPSVGVYAFWDDAGWSGNNLALHTEAWPTDWFAASVRERIAFGNDRTLQLGVWETHRPDKVFYGVGPTTLEAYQSRYALQKLEASAAYEWRFWRSSRIETMVGVRDVSVSNGHFDGDPNLTTEASTGAFAVPYGFGKEYTAEANRIIAAFDTRAAESRRGSGIRLELDAEQGNDVRSSPSSGWLRYGATAAAYVDLTGHRRVLGVSLMTQMADPLGPEPVPFTELVYLGGDHPMRGFFNSRLLGRSAAVATASYAWPIGPWIDGDFQLAVGNVFGEHLQGFDAGLLRFSGAFGLSIGGFQTKSAMGAEDAPIELLIGVGSETFDQGGQIDSLRVMAGVPFSF